MSDRNHYDAIVLGLGGMGSAALYTLAKRGLKVCGIDQHHVPHEYGSSHGALRIIRKAYFEHPDYVPLLHRAYEAWEALSSERDETLFSQNGLVLSGKPDSETVRGLEACYAQHNLPHENLSASEATRRFPHFAFPEDHQAFYDPQAGYLRVEDCVLAYIKRAQELGARVRIHEPALRWEAGADSVTVTTEQADYTADRLILTLGPWAAELLEEFGVKLELLRKVQLWYEISDIDQTSAQEFPCFACEMDYGFFYGFPPIDDTGVKVGEHTGGHAVARPEDSEPALSSKDQQSVQRFIADFFPGHTVTLTHHSPCLYTMTPDENFIVDRHPTHANVCFAAGFSGHGFKFAPVIGETLADLAIEGKTHHPVEFLRMNRLLDS